MNKLTTVLLLLLACFTQAQDFSQTIKGQVLDQQSKSPIIGATIVVKGTDPLIGSTTDMEGYFRIPNVPIGRQTLVFSSVGYDSKTIPNIHVTSGKEVVLTVDLIESLVEMEAVVVVAENQEKGKPQNDMATVSAIALAEETSRYPATFGDPARAALSLPGVTTGGDDLLNEIVVRGNSPKGILWRLEGVEIPNPNHFTGVGSAAGGISMLSSAVLSASDFYTAAFPAQYGNASSGVFDLKMRNGNFDKSEYSFQSGLIGLQASAEGPFSQNSNASYLVNYRYSTLGLLSAVGVDIIGEEEDIAFQDLSFKVNVPTKKYGRFSIWGLGGRNTYGGKFISGYNFSGDSAFAVNWIDRFGATPDSVAFWQTNETNIQHMGAAGVTHTAYLSKNTYLESVISYTGQSLKYEWDSASVRLLEKEVSIQNTLRVSSLVNHKFNARNTLRVGGIMSRLAFDLESWEWDDGRFHTFLEEDGHTYFYQGFAQWQHRLTQNLTFNSGFHVSYFDLNKDLYIEPRIGYRWQLMPQLALTGGLGLHSRMESVAFYMAKQEQEDGSHIKPNENLKFSKAAHAVGGVEYMLRPNMRLKSEIYYQYLYDVPVWPVDTGDAFIRSVSMINQYDGYTTWKLANKGTGENYGIEVTLEQFYTQGKYFMINGSLYESKYKGIDGVERNTIFNGGFIFNALGGKEWSWHGGRRVFDINARFIWAGGKREAPILLEESRNQGFTVRDFDRNFEAKLNNYWRIDFGMNYKINRPKTAYVLSINVQNLFAVENEYERYYAQGQIQSAAQLGFFPNLSYRIEF